MTFLITYRDRDPRIMAAFATDQFRAGERVNTAQSAACPPARHHSRSLSMFRLSSGADVRGPSLTG
jgi:hypothetical protein